MFLFSSVAFRSFCLFDWLNSIQTHADKRRQQYRGKERGQGNYLCTIKTHSNCTQIELELTTVLRGEIQISLHSAPNFISHFVLLLKIITYSSHTSITMPSITNTQCFWCCFLFILLHFFSQSSAAFTVHHTNCFFLLSTFLLVYTIPMFTLWNQENISCFSKCAKTTPKSYCESIKTVSLLLRILLFTQCFSIFHVISNWMVILFFATKSKQLISISRCLSSFALNVFARKTNHFHLKNNFESNKFYGVNFLSHKQWFDLFRNVVTVICSDSARQAEIRRIKYNKKEKKKKYEQKIVDYYCAIVSSSYKSAFGFWKYWTIVSCLFLSFD